MKTQLIKLLLIGLVFIGSCNKDENNDTPSVSNTYSITLAGQINDENGQGIPNVTVQVGNKIDLTDDNGIYLIEKASVNKSRAVVKATKTGYWNRSIGFIPSNSTVQYCNFVMPQKAAATSIQSATSGSVSSAGATVVFPPNAFVTATGLPYNGTVNITSKHLPTSDPNFGALIPGGDLMAEDTTGNSVKLISYGMIGIELTDNNGNPLQLGPGIKANIQLPIASAQLSSAPATIPLWYFDETKNLWIEEGIATKQGNNYVGQVGHFSWWNCDQPTPAATISGYVYDNYGNPIVNATIYYNNVAGTITDQTGFYSGQVNSGLTASIYATFIGNNSPLLNIPSLSAGQLYNVPDIIINGNSLGRFKANFVNCNNQPANTYVKFSGATSNSFIYAPNGIVNTIIQCGAQSINAYTSNSFFDSTFIQPCLPDSIDLGTVSICTPNASNFQFLSFNLSFNNITYNYYDDYFVNASYQALGNAIYINSETINPSETAYLTIANFFTYAPGTYTISNAQNGIIDLQHWGNGFYYTTSKDLTNSQPTLTLTILQSGMTGDTLEFTLQGNVNVMENGSGLIYTGTINSMHLKCLNF
ncbi:MAG: carboxypeptidase-like regulatory domain-containing protein [Bacteroidia bacterium]